MNDKQKKAIFYEYDLSDLTSSEIEALKAFAIKNIVNDEKELINYAVNKIIEIKVEEMIEESLKKAPITKGKKCKQK